MKRIVPLFLVLLTTPALANVDANKKLVRSFYELSFRDHKPTEAAKKYLGTKYTQHNPHVPDGPEAFYGYFEPYFKTHPKAVSEIKRVVAEGDLVVLHALSKSDEKDRGHAVVDIFRVANGKIVEHWDVMQDVPETAANTNTMF